MEINETFVRTSKNYDINSFSVPENIFETKNSNKKFLGFSTNFQSEIKSNNSKPFSPLSNKAEKQFENPDISLQFDIEKNYSEPIILNFSFDKNNSLIDKIKLNINEKINAKIIINYFSKNKVFHNGFIKINCKENSNAKVVLICDLSSNSDNFLTYENKVGDGAKLDFSIVDFCGNYSVHRYINDAVGNCSSSCLRAMYVSDSESKIDLNFAQNVYGKNADVSIFSVGVLQGKSIKNFKGMIDFKNGSTKSKGDENELCLLLSKDAKSKAMPLLCCGEEDVEGSHSSATGKIGENELFYIMSRGLDKTEGLKMLLRAKFNNVVDNIFDDELKQQINENIDRKIINEER